MEDLDFSKSFSIIEVFFKAPIIEKMLHNYKILIYGSEGFRRSLSKRFNM